ncbi:S-methyl-5-thioribose kinase [Bacillus carboniphilus]|uniref:Methylthioribose kinase n=1 Tax=Bacillus carboniphilus TaxID=86663 RepID=A0ABN0WRA2_9BACI
MAIPAQVEQTYQPLTESAAIELAYQLNLFKNDTVLESREIGDGNLNLVFHIVEKGKEKGVIIKQALPYAKVVGESWPLSLNRAVIEANALKLHGKYAPGLVPEVYYTDDTLAVTVMEDLSHLTIARTGLIQGENYPLLSEHVGQYLARTLFYTSDYALDPGEKKELAKKFVNPDLCKITEDLVLTDPFFNHDTNDFEDGLQEEVHKLWGDFLLKLEVAKLKKTFLTEGEALIHGDLHTGSIFASETETKVIDPEFAFYGPIGFDVGQVFANLLFQVITRPDENRAPIINHIETVWAVFREEFSRCWEQDGQDVFTKTEGYLDYVLEKIWKDSVGYAGCELIRRTIGLSHVKDLDGIEDEKSRLTAKKNTIRLGRSLILNREKISSIQAFKQEIAWFSQA